MNNVQQSGRFKHTFEFGIPIPLIVLLYVFSALLLEQIPGYLDFTEDKRFTLPDSVLEELSSLDNKVTVRFFSTSSHPEFGFDLARYQRRIEESLAQLEQNSNNKLTVEILDPNLSAKAARIATIDEVRSTVIKGGDPFMFGLVVESLDRKRVFHSIDPQREKYFFSDLVQAILYVGRNDRKKISVLTPFTISRTDALSIDYWSGIKVLEKSYDIAYLELDKDFNKSDIIVLFHSSFKDPVFEQKIRAFMQQGGDVIALVDPLSIMSETHANSGATALRSSQLPDFITERGIRLEKDKEVYDFSLLTERGTEDGSTIDPTVLTLGLEQFNPDHPVTAGFDFVHFINAGALTVNPPDNYTTTALIRSSRQAGLLDTRYSVEADAAGIQRAVRELPDLDIAYTLAVIQEPIPPSVEGRLLVVADTDWLYEAVAGGLDQNGSINAYNSNLNLIQNMVDYLAGSEALGELRSKIASKKPLTHWNNIQKAIAEPFFKPISDISDQIAASEATLSRLNSGRKDISSQRKQSAKFEQQITKIREQIRNLNADLSALKRTREASIKARLNLIKWTNILLFPLLIGLLGMIVVKVRANKVRGKKL